MRSDSFSTLFPTIKPIIGMIHLLPLPNTPAYENNWQQIVDHAVAEAIYYQKTGIDAVMIENMHDTPYVNGYATPEVIAAMSIIAHKIKSAINLPCGIQILAGANKAALAVAKAAQLDFVRVEGFVFGHVADEGWIDAQAGELLRYRRQIDAQHILVWTDIKKKHAAHALTQDVNLLETAHAAQFFRSDGVIITGSATGQATDLVALQTLQNKVKLPIIIGSGITADNLPQYFSLADAFIVGSYFKENGHWANALNHERILRLMEV
ncbi:MAG: BtpA/SgcQ family protein, partial [Chitinophagales bacterium]